MGMRTVEFGNENQIDTNTQVKVAIPMSGLLQKIRTNWAGPVQEAHPGRLRQ